LGFAGFVLDDFAANLALTKGISSRHVLAIELHTRTREICCLEIQIQRERSAIVFVSVRALEGVENVKSSHFDIFLNSCDDPFLSAVIDRHHRT
jgi:hypothetical protein